MGVATGMSEARSHPATWDEQAHAHASSMQGIVPHDDPPKRPGRRENVRTPGPIAWSQRLRGMSPLRKQPRSRERARRGYTQFDWVAEIGRTYRASSLPGTARSSGRKRALAWRKSVAPPDAGRGWVEGETVRLLRANR